MRPPQAPAAWAPSSRPLGGSGAALQCIVCGAAAQPQPPGADAGPAVCLDAACRWVASRYRDLPAPAFSHHVTVHAKLLRARREERERQEQQRRDQMAREAAENDAAWAATKSQLAERLPPRHELAALPTGPRRLHNLPQRERNRYRDHLTRIIAEALSTAEVAAEPLEDASDEAPAAAQLRANLCTLCAGGCCTQGGHKAYLTAATIRRVMAGQPGLRPRELLAAYLERVGTRHEAGSCVNHGPQGCTLPREMRSGTCNRFLCPPLREIQARQSAADPPLAVVVVVRRQDHWNKLTPGRANDIVGTALVTASGITPVTP